MDSPNIFFGKKSRSCPLINGSVYFNFFLIHSGKILQQFLIHFFKKNSLSDFFYMKYLTNFSFFFL